MTSREKKILTVFIILVLAVGFWYFIYEPTEEEIEDLENTIEIKESRLNTHIARAQQVPELEEEVDQLETRLHELEDEERTIGDLLLLLNNLTTEYNVQMKRFSPQQSDTEIRLDLVIEGSYRNVAEMVYALRHREERIGLYLINMRPVDERSGKVSAEIFCVYYTFEHQFD